MTKADYERRKALKLQQRRRQMEDADLEAKGKATMALLLDAVKAFFEGKAAIMIGELPVRFKKDQE